MLMRQKHHTIIAKTDLSQPSNLLLPLGTVHVEKQPVVYKYCCVEYWCEKARNTWVRETGRRDMTLNVETLNPN